MKVLGRCGSFDDPTDFVIDEWPWLDGESADVVLSRLSAKETLNGGDLKSKFDPLEALIRLQSNRSAHDTTMNIV